MANIDRKARVDFFCREMMGQSLVHLLDHAMMPHFDAKHKKSHFHIPGDKII